jgi:Fic-DOC domain mobile mystery protein B
MMKFNYPVGSTPLEHEELAALIPDHITTQAELNAWEEKNILIAQQWALRQKEILSVSFIKKLHERMFNETWKWAGEFRKSEKNIGIHWPQISIKIKELCDDVQYQLDHNTFSKDEIAVRFHHRLVFIHPFVNGNGRHARLMADLLIMQQGDTRFSWGMNQDLYNATPVRKQYIASLRLADQGDYSKLLIFARS